jgi:hypothetical protein
MLPPFSDIMSDSSADMMACGTLQMNGTASKPMMATSGPVCWV